MCVYVYVCMCVYVCVCVCVCVCVWVWMWVCLGMCVCVSVCYRPPVCFVCLNHEVVVFQPQIVTAPYLGSVANAYT